MTVHQKIDADPRHAALASREAIAERSKFLAPTAKGQNFYEIDTALRSLLPLYMENHSDLLEHLQPHLSELGELAGGRLTELSETCERHNAELHYRDPYGRNEEYIEHHPAYRGMQDIAFGKFGLHVMTHKAGVMGWDAPMPPIAKYAFHYLFSQAEFGLLCPVNLTDSSSELVRRFGNEELKAKYLDRMWSQDVDELLQASQFMTEKIGGSDAGAAQLTAVKDGDNWRLYGEKWFCSNADADLSVLLARPEGAVEGGKGVGLFLMPKTLDDGSRNDYRIIRLKDKLGSKTMASGEIVFEGALAYHLGDIDQGMKQMLVMVNSSRISHLCRAAGMMRRCLNEAMVTSKGRNAFGKRIVDHPLMRRQLMKLMVPTEQALSLLLYASQLTEKAESDPVAAKTLRMITPLAKYRASRDNVHVATGAMEARGGNGYIEDWPNARLVRDAHLGLIWEGTSNINALDAIQRAVKKNKAHEPLLDDLRRRLEDASQLPGQYRTRLEASIDDAFRFAEEVAAEPENERFSRMASAQLYHAVTATLMAEEGMQLGKQGGDARRMLLSRFVLEHKMQTQRPTRLADLKWEDEATTLLLSDEPVSLDAAQALMVG